MLTSTPDHEHTTWDEQLVWTLSIMTRSFCIMAALYVFFGATYLPGCDVSALTGNQPIIAYIPLGVLAVATAYFTIYGSNWTPQVGKYESIDVIITGILGAIVLFGVVSNRGAMNDMMLFTAWMFGTLVVLGILLDWIGRITKWNYLRKQAKLAQTPVTTS